MPERGYIKNIAGLDAVEVRLNTGKSVYIGTDESDCLVTALEKATGISVAGSE